MTELIDTLPPNGRSEGREAANLAFAAQLRRHPGKWGVYPNRLKNQDVAGAMGWRIRHNLAPSFRPGFEARVRQGILYVCYVGTEEP